MNWSGKGQSAAAILRRRAGQPRARQPACLPTAEDTVQSWLAMPPTLSPNRAKLAAQAQAQKKSIGKR